MEYTKKEKKNSKKIYYFILSFTKSNQAGAKT